MVFGVDPGPERGAVALYNGTLVTYAYEADNEALIKALRAPAHFSSLLAVEKVESFGMAVGAEVFETVFFSGRLVQVWRDNHFGKDFRIGRKEVKIHLCGSMKAKDANIRQALIDKLGAPGTKKNPGPTYGVSGHMWAALAVAVTCAETRLKEG